MTSLVTRQRIETAALLLAVFIAGGLGGAALERRAHDERRDDGDRGRRSGVVAPPGEIPRYYEELDLTAEQRRQIQDILDAARPESDSLLRTALPRLRELTAMTREAISDVLTDEQKAELRERFQRRDRSRESRRDDGRRGRDDGSTGRRRRNR